MTETAVKESNNQIIDIGKQDISKQLEQKKNIIRNTLAEDATKGEFEMFMHLAKTYQLDPFQKEIFFWKYKGDTTIMTSRDGYLKIANRHPEFDGIDSGVIRPGDNFKKTDQGVKHELKVENLNKTPSGAYAVVYRNDRKKPVIVVVPFQEYKKDKKVWRNYPTAMIQKVAESMALKRAFSVSGLVSKEEMDLEQNEPDPQDITPKPESIEKDTKKSKNNYKNKNKSNKKVEMTLKEAKEKIIPGGDKYGDKPAKEIKDWRLEWVKNNWKDEEIREAARLVYENRDSDKKDKKKELSERQKEIQELTGGETELVQDVQMFLKENDTDKVDDLSKDEYEVLVGLLEDEDGEQLADEAAENIE